MNFWLINSYIILATLFIIYIIFLLFDLFQRNEKYGFLAYLVALLPVNYLWVLIPQDPLLIYVILFILWIACLVRDLVFVYGKTKEYDDIILFLVLGIIIQIIITAILPEIILETKTNTAKFWFFYLPDVYTNTFLIESWVNTYILLAFRILTTLLIIMALTPLILDIKDEEVKFPVVIIIVVIFIIPFLILGWIWYPPAMVVLTFLFSVVLLVVLLIITRSGKET
ncbi:MAG: hypothetical protein EU548_05700 [Promethearchaeota archaeon]|nr:MAG: hypothetical protein EU548_05700 [Candidatus Lokiarchaeota archaeon]